jgi:hypothetical protein
VDSNPVVESGANENRALDREDAIPMLSRGG